MTDYLPARLTAGMFRAAFQALNVATDGRSFARAAKSVVGYLDYHARDRECRELYDLANALGRFDIFVPGLSYDETAARVIEYIVPVTEQDAASRARKITRELETLTLKVTELAAERESLIRELISRHGWSQHQVAAALGISQPRVHGILEGS